MLTGIFVREREIRDDDKKDRFKNNAKQT